MTNRILTEHAINVSDLKMNPMEALKAGHGEAVAVMRRTQMAFYLLPIEVYERLREIEEDQELLLIADSRKDEEMTMVDINEL